MKNGAEWRADEAPAAIVVAGGEGQRFRDLLERMQRWAARLVPAERTLFCVTRAQERFHGGALAGLAPSSLVGWRVRGRMAARQRKVEWQPAPA